MKKAIQLILLGVLAIGMAGCVTLRTKDDGDPPVVLRQHKTGDITCVEMDKNKDGKTDIWLVVSGDSSLGVHMVGNADLDGDGKVDAIGPIVDYFDRHRGTRYHRQFALGLRQADEHNLFIWTDDSGWSRLSKDGKRWAGSLPHSLTEDDWYLISMDWNSDGTPDWWCLVRHDDGSYVENVDTDYDGEVDAIAIVLSSPDQRDIAAQRPPRIILIRRDQENNVFFPVGDKGWNEWWNVYKVDSPVLKQERNKEKSNQPSDRTR